MKKVDPPKHRKDWIGKRLLLKRGWEPGRCTPPDGIPVTIGRRMNASETLNCGIDVANHDELKKSGPPCEGGGPAKG